MKQFKKGDILTVESPRGKSTFIFAGGEVKKVPTTVETIFCVDQAGKSGSGAIYLHQDCSDLRLADMYEGKYLFECMANGGLKYDSDKREMDGVKEEKKFEPQGGDSIISGRGSVAIIGDIDANFEYPVSFQLNNVGDVDYDCGVFTRGYIKCEASSEEAGRAISALSKDGKTWNAEKKRVEKVLWRAEKNSKYWHCDTSITPSEWTDVLDSMDDECYYYGNYFQTESECQEYCDKIKEVLDVRKQVK